MPAIKLGELLIKANVLQETQLRTALSEQTRWGGRLGEVLVRMTLVTEDLLVRALSKQLGTPVANLDGLVSLQPAVLEKLSADGARRLGAIPLQLKDNGKTLIVAMCEPQNPDHLERLRVLTGCRIMAQLTGRSAFRRAYQRFYGEAAGLAGDGDPLTEGEPPVVPELTAGDTREVTALDVGVPEGLAAEASEPITALTRLEEAPRPGSDGTELQAMVELLIEKGVFTREEFLSKLRR